MPRVIFQRGGVYHEEECWFAERAIRVILDWWCFHWRSWGPSRTWAYLGIIPLATGLIGWCPPCSIRFLDLQVLQVRAATYRGGSRGSLTGVAILDGVSHYRGAFLFWDFYHAGAGASCSLIELQSLRIWIPGSRRGRNADSLGGRVLKGSHRLLSVGSTISLKNPLDTNRGKQQQ